MPDQWHKPTADKFPIQLDWTAWLTLVNDTISTSTWICVPGTGGLVAASPAPSVLNPLCTQVWVESGTVGQKYRLFNRIVTVGGRTRTKEVHVTIDEIPT